MQVYADNAATTKICPRAMEAMVSCMESCYANPSSLHSLGRQARKRLEEARTAAAQCLGCGAREIFFTSGGTEADCQAILTAAALGEKQGKTHLITTAFEHPAVLNTVKKLESRGFTATYLPIDPKTHNINPGELQKAIRRDTCLVSAMYVNNEIGSVLPIAALGTICRQAQVLFHVDGVQAAGKLPSRLGELPVDFLSISGHKFHGPKGVGALYVRKGLELTSILEGGSQERGKRPGTENLPGICGMAAALEDACEHMEENRSRLEQLHGRLVSGLSEIPGGHFNGDREQFLPGIVNISFEGIEGETLLVLLDSMGICASAGSACSSGSMEPSHVLLALGRSRELARGSLRLSLDGQNTPEEVDYLIEKIQAAVNQLRAWS